MGQSWSSSDSRPFYEEGHANHSGKQGSWKAYERSTGILSGIETYTDGRLDGSYQRFNRDGRLIYDTTYKKGVEVGPRYVNGELESKESLHECRGPTERQ